MLLTDKNILLHLSISRITFLSYEEKLILAKNIDNTDKLALSSIEDICNILHKQPSKRCIWNGKSNLHSAQVALHYCKTLGIKIVLHSDKEYPELLRQISDPPYLLFCRGDEKLLGERSVSVVGTRRLSPVGKQSASSFAYDACMNGCNVVSGLASGADSFAHKGAINAYFDGIEKGMNGSGIGKTIAVLPGSIDNIIPSGNKNLAEKIIQTGGLLVSEYEPGLEIAKWHFVARNRIIAGLSPATVVVEAPAGSGALITADFALEMDRDLLFHKATFGEMAKQIAGTLNAQLESEHAAGKVSKYKVENRPEKFLEAGAPVIEDYKDYLKYLTEAPGTRVVPLQGELFS